MREIVTPKLDEVGLLVRERLEQGRELHEYLVGVNELLEEVGIEKKPFGIFKASFLRDNTSLSGLGIEFETVVLIHRSLGVGVNKSEQDDTSNVYACVFDTGQVRLLGVGYPTGQIDSQLEVCGYDFSRLSSVMLSGALQHSKSIFEVKTPNDVIFNKSKLDAVQALNDVMGSIDAEVWGSLSTSMAIETP